MKKPILTLVALGFAALFSAAAQTPAGFAGRQ